MSSLIPPPIRYAVLRSGLEWPEATITGLEPTLAGDMRLRLLPAVSPPVSEPPAKLPASGLALDDRCHLYVADAADGLILAVGLDCDTLVALPGPPVGTSGGTQWAGLCFGPHGWLFAADPRGGQVVVLAVPELAARDVWEGFTEPVGLACHHDSVLVLDIAGPRVTRYDAFGRPDAPFNTAFTTPAGAAAIAAGPDGTIYVGDATGVTRSDWDGAAVAPDLAQGTEPVALAVDGSVLYLADGASGDVLLYSLPDGAQLGAVAGFTGPVTALAGRDGTVFVKTDDAAGYVLGQPRASYLNSGQVSAGPIDAGAETEWERLAAKCDVPPLTSATVEWFTADDPNQAVIAWQSARSLDLLLPGGRYLWTRVTLATRDPTVSPTLHQVEARTTGESYLDNLPELYTRERGPDAFIVKLLELARSQLGDLEAAIDALPSYFDPATAPVPWLDWLASWMAFQLPAGLLDGSDSERTRKLLLGLAMLYPRRGTIAGVVDFVQIYSGVRPHLFEEFRARPLWVLGETPLGFGSGLIDRDLEGLIVGEANVGETGLEEANEWGEAAFRGTAHQFTVLVPPAPGLDEAGRQLVRQVIDTEKPAHTGYHVCFAEPEFRVGIQARVGLDAIVARAPEGTPLGEDFTLDLDARLGGEPEQFTLGRGLGIIPTLAGRERASRCPTTDSTRDS